MTEQAIADAVWTLQEDGFSEELQLVGDGLCWLATGQVYEPNLFAVRRIIPVNFPSKARVVGLEIRSQVANPIRGFLVDSRNELFPWSETPGVENDT